MREEYTFENFVAGSENDEALKLAKEVCLNGETSPLFIVGEIATGKTHLMQAIANEYKINNPVSVVEYMSCETLINCYVDSLRSRQHHQFRERFRSVDILLIEDIEFLSRGRQIQEEFYNIFNHLNNENKQIVLSSLNSPRKIKGLDERLASRFSSGVILNLKHSSIQSRLKIIEKRLYKENSLVSDNILILLAEELSLDTRSMLGVLTNILCMSKITGPSITQESVIRLVAVYQEDERNTLSQSTCNLKGHKEACIDTVSSTPIREIIKKSFIGLQDILRGDSQFGIKTGFTAFDTLTHGIKAGDLVTFAGYNREALTPFTVSMVLNLCHSTMQKTPIHFVALGSDEVETTTKLMCTEANTPLKCFYDGTFSNSDMPALTSAVSLLKCAPIYIEAKSQITLSELKENTIQLVNDSHVDLVIIDDLLRVVVPGTTNQSDQLSTVCIELKNLAKELSVPIVTTVQCDAEKVANTKECPTIHSLPGDGAVFNNSDVVAFLHCDHDAEKKLEEDMSCEDITTVLVVEKNINDETGICKLNYFPQYGLFKDIYE